MTLLKQVLIAVLAVLLAGRTALARPLTGAESRSLAEAVLYLLRVNDARQLTIMRQVYPEFAGIEFPGGSMQGVK